MDYVWGYEKDSDYAEEDGEKEVRRNERDGKYAIYPEPRGTQLVNTTTFFLCLMFFTYFLLSTWQTEYGIDKIDLEEAAGHAAPDFFATWKKGL
jgi:hypothetical protein